jgi:hypothetical protein
VSTFHEFGASLGAAVVSSIAAASLSGASSAGFSRGFTAAALVAAAAAVVTLAVAPGRQAPPGAISAGEHKDLGAGSASASSPMGDAP